MYVYIYVSVFYTQISLHIGPPGSSRLWLILVTQPSRLSGPALAAGFTPSVKVEMVKPAAADEREDKL